MNARWPRTMALGLASLLALLLAGCGAGFDWSDYEFDDTTTYQPTPLAGRYSGVLRDYGATASYWFRLVSATEAQGRANLAGTTVDLVGEITEAHHLRLTGDGLVIEGDFRGAYHPLDASYYEWRGVEFRAVWTRPDESTGAAIAYHEAWPPALHDHHYDNPWYDDWDDNDWSWSGGGSGGTSGGGSGGGVDSGTGGGGSVDTGGGSGGGGPIDGSGDTTDDSVVWRGPKGRR